jgi:ABC-2 type transport system permease protein
MIAAILRAQWLSMRFTTRGRFFGLAVGVIWYGMWAVLAWVAGVGIAGAELGKLRVFLPLGLLCIFLYWQFMPVVSATMGAGLDLRKLIAYPVPHRKLFIVEVLLRFTTAFEMVLLVAGGIVGVIANPAAGGWRGAGRIALALPLFLAFNLLLASGLRSLLERLLARRRVREVVVLCMAMLWVLPRFLLSTGVRMRPLSRFAAAMQTVLLPWTALSQAATGQSLAPSLASLSAWAVAAALFGRWQFERSLRYDTIASQASPQTASGRTPWVERFYRLPSALLPDPVAGIVEKELRSLARTPRFRTVFIMGFTFGLVVWFPVVAASGKDEGPGGSWFMTVVCVYALTLLGQVSYWNSFGFDRSAAAFYFAAPVSVARVLVGKNIAALIYIYLEVTMVISMTAIFGLSSGWGQAAETLIVMSICACYLLALGNLGSVHYPRALSAERVSQGGGRGFQGLLFLVYPIALLPVGLAYLARYAFASTTIFALALGIAAILGGTFYWMGLESAVATAGRRREQIVQELSQSDGPVTGQ